ncbi:hypothetical protein C4544_01975 [candidate division WS5 bacterium]|uniref:Uncharacterized protein n=1 Tax=candidate division WS5 bacterium TaxID=2093353 RepID=A0A419DF71_9BACT|nr:MAG: hypothetical protein C4544_01975 [candidate division WS5 bacterium]
MINLQEATEGIKAIVRQQIGGYSNYCLEGRANVDFRPYAFACIYPLNLAEYMFLQFDKGAADPLEHASRILSYKVPDEASKGQHELTEVFKGMSEEEFLTASQVYAAFSNPCLPFTFVMFGKTHPDEVLIAAIYHPQAFPTTYCLNLLKAWAAKRVMKNN